MSSKSISSEEPAKMLAEYRRDYETRLQSRPNIEAQQARQVVQKARDLIRQSGIGDALTLLLQEVKHWPSWSQRDDLIKSVHFPATDMTDRHRSVTEIADRLTFIGRKKPISRPHFGPKCSQRLLTLHFEGDQTPSP